MKNINTRHPVEQIPLGELLFNARTALGWSRQKLADVCNEYEKTISSNSIVRYEKAGSDDPDGQYPTSPKLAILCFVLRIDPSQALWACLSEKHYKHASHDEGFVEDHPQVSWLMHQFEQLLKDNYQLRSALFTVLKLENDCGFDFGDADEERNWIINSAINTMSRNEDYIERMMLNGSVELKVNSINTHPSTIPSARFNADISKSGKLTSVRKVFLNYAEERILSALDTIRNIKENSEASLATAPSSQDE